eukprot:3459810-Amphidinium_carterae.3
MISEAFHVVDTEMMSSSSSSSSNEEALSHSRVTRGDGPKNAAVRVMAYQRTLQDGRVVM